MSTLLQPRILTLITTHQCTAACDHCCFACTPYVTDRISPDRLRRLIDETQDVPSIGFVSFVGGECFLLGTELDERVAQAAGRGLRVGTTTNGYWAVNRRAAVRRIASLHDAGLGVISFSTGEMHARFVPVERIVHGAVAAGEAGLEVSISIEEFADSTFDPESVTGHPEIQALVDAGRLSVFMRDWIPHADGIGVAKLRHAAPSRLFAPDVAHGGCGIVLDDVTITPALSITACCGYPVESIPELELGSVAEMTLGAALAAAPEDVLHLWLRVAGPERMLLFVKRNVPGYRLPLDAVHPCQACLHLHRDPVAMRVLRENAPEFRDALVAAHLALTRSAAGVLSPLS